VPVAGEEIETVRQETPAAVVDTDLGGLTYVGDCAEIRPLSIDPQWDPETQELIREAARWWEGAVGVDLGELQTAEEPCTREARVRGCIARRDVHIVGPDSRPLGIDIYAETLKAHGGGYGLLQRAVAHEVGHWIGIRAHTESGVMSTHNALAWRELTRWDVEAYEQACIN
jgi:hypothetical protein